MSPSTLLLPTQTSFSGSINLKTPLGIILKIIKFQQIRLKSRRFYISRSLWSRNTHQLQLACVGILDNFIGQSMQRFRAILLVISAVFLIASCGSSTSATTAVNGLDAPSKLKYL